MVAFIADVVMVVVAAMVVVAVVVVAVIVVAVIVVAVVVVIIIVAMGIFFRDVIDIAEMIRSKFNRPKIAENKDFRLELKLKSVWNILRTLSDYLRGRGSSRGRLTSPTKSRIRPKKRSAPNPGT